MPENLQLSNINPQMQTNSHDGTDQKLPDNSEILNKNTLNTQQERTNEILNNIRVLNKEQIKMESATTDVFNKISENSSITSNKENLNKNENKGKISIDMIVPIKTLNLLKNFQNNIYLEMENKYGCQITKRAEVILFFRICISFFLEIFCRFFLN